MPTVAVKVTIAIQIYKILLVLQFVTFSSVFTPVAANVLRLAV